jgi:nitrite reductase/ring-hydroxylating ferredoxin subunit
MDNQIFIQKDSFTKDPSTVKFTFLEGGENQAGFIVYFNAKYYAYRNKCQHLAVELDWDNNNFFEEEERFIVCATHGAIYEPSSGKCLMGPCKGKNLEILNLRVLEDKLIVTI